MIKNGAKPVTKILSDEEYKLELNKKLLEEVNEYLESDDILELADIQEVLLALINTTNMTYEEFEKIRKEKVSKRGAFDNKIFLEKEE